MPLHLIKLCVGIDSVAELRLWVEQRTGGAEAYSHVTRMAPKRRDELLDGGSLYWVIKGQIACRQPIHDLQTFKDSDGISRCAIILEPRIVDVSPRPFRAFQGWRYLAATDCPPDLAEKDGQDELPESMRHELAALGLL